MNHKYLPNRMSFKIESVDDVEKAMDLTNHLAKAIGFLPNDQLLLRLVTEEAIVNALEHGTNFNDPLVKAAWQVNKDILGIFISQKGKPFKVEKKENLNVSLRGRGIQLILHIMDDVWIEEKDDGITFCMKKSLNSKEKEERES